MLAHAHWGWVLATTTLGAMGLGCGESGESAEPEGERFGAVRLLPGDPSPPPEFSPDELLLDLGVSPDGGADPSARGEFCGWLATLPRPMWAADCSAPPGTFIGRQSVVTFCWQVVGGQLLDRECDVALEELVGCAVDIAECSTTRQRPRRCALMQRPECFYDFDAVPASR